MSSKKKQPRKVSTWTDPDTGRTVRRCVGCEQVKDLIDDFPIGDAQSRYPSKRWGYQCLVCTAAFSRRQYRKRRADPVRNEQLKRYWRDYAKKHRAMFPEIHREAVRRYQAKVRQDPERLARQRDYQKMSAKLRRERDEGRPLPTVDVRAGQSLHGGPRIPGIPLAKAIERMVRREAMALNQWGPVDDRERVGWSDNVCEQLGVSPRAYYRWRHGLNAELGPADAVLTRSGLHWWDVWNEDTVRKPALVVLVVKRSRKHKNGRAYWDVTARVPYGDLGPDVDELRRVAAAFGDDIEEEAA